MFTGYDPATDEARTCRYAVENPEPAYTDVRTEREDRDYLRLPGDDPSDHPFWTEPEYEFDRPNEFMWMPFPDIDRVIADPATDPVTRRKAEVGRAKRSMYYWDGTPREPQNRDIQEAVHGGDCVCPACSVPSNTVTLADLWGTEE